MDDYHNQPNSTSNQKEEIVHFHFTKMIGMLCLHLGWIFILGNRITKLNVGAKEKDMNMERRKTYLLENVEQKTNSQ